MVEKWMASWGYGRLGGTGREGAGWGKGSCQTPTLEGSGMCLTRPASADGPDPKGFAPCRRPPLVIGTLVDMLVGMRGELC